MSIELYPDHKAILHFYDSLTVFEIDFLSALTTLLARAEYAERAFHLYVKPTLFQSAFDFVVVEPQKSVFIFQTPENVEEFEEKRQAFQQNIEATPQNKAIFKELYYLYDTSLLEALVAVEDEVVLLTPQDFERHSEILQQTFAKKTTTAAHLTAQQTQIMQQVLNPNTNIKHYISRSLPKPYEEKAKSKAQTKQKFKGPQGAGKTSLLVKRVVNCAKRLNQRGKILVVAGDAAKATDLKDLITAEDGRSLQELGIDIEHYEQLTPPKVKYHALFIDDAEELETAAFHDLLDHYLVEMNETNDYEYVVMADEDHLPQVPKILGPYHTLNKEAKLLNDVLVDSRKIFLRILEG